MKLIWNFLFFLKRTLNKVQLKIRYGIYKQRGVIIGKNTYISPKAYIDTHPPGKVTIGENCYITRNVVILNHSDTKKGGPLSLWKERGGKRLIGDVIIGKNVFIGVNSVIMPGVKIHDDVIIGALSLVNSDIPKGKIAAGIPAKVIGNTADHINNLNH